VKVTACRDCGQTIWVIQDVNTGRWRPINPEDRISRSAKDGNIVLVYGYDHRGRRTTQCRQLDHEELAGDAMHHRHTPHQATCRGVKRPAA
jgi:hypothetical protein